MKKLPKNKYFDDYGVFKRVLLNAMKAEIQLDPENRTQIAKQYFFYFHRLEMLIDIAKDKNIYYQKQYDDYRNQVISRSDLNDIDKVLYIITATCLFMNDVTNKDICTDFEDMIILSIDSEITKGKKF